MLLQGNLEAEGKHCHMHACMHACQQCCLSCRC
jgi:hypothetical protein